MEVGDIITSDGKTLTIEDLRKIAVEVEKLISSNSKDPGEWEEVKSLSGTQYHDAYAPIEIAHNGNNLIYLLLVPFKQGLVEHVSYSRTDT